MGREGNRQVELLRLYLMGWWDGGYQRWVPRGQHGWWSISEHIYREQRGDGEFPLQYVMSADEGWKKHLSQRGRLECRQPVEGSGNQGCGWGSVPLKCVSRRGWDQKLQRNKFWGVERMKGTHSRLIHKTNKQKMQPSSFSLTWSRVLVNHKEVTWSKMTNKEDEMMWMKHELQKRKWNETQERSYWQILALLIGGLAFRTLFSTCCGWINRFLNNRTFKSMCDTCLNFQGAINYTFLRKWAMIQLF